MVFLSLIVRSQPLLIQSTTHLSLHLLDYQSRVNGALRRAEEGRTPETRVDGKGRRARVSAVPRGHRRQATDRLQGSGLGGKSGLEISAQIEQDPKLKAMAGSQGCQLGKEAETEREMRKNAEGGWEDTVKIWNFRDQKRCTVQQGAVWSPSGNRDPKFPQRGTYTKPSARHIN